MSKHTPGPWSVNPPFFKNWDSRCIYGVTEYVACVGGVENCRETIDANARLIAAAPELLEALETIMSDWLKRADCVLPKETCEKVIIAIAKAKGE